MPDPDRIARLENLLEFFRSLRKSASSADKPFPVRDHRTDESSADFRRFSQIILFLGKSDRGARMLKPDIRHLTLQSSISSSFLLSHFGVPVFTEH